MFTRNFSSLVGGDVRVIADRLQQGQALGSNAQAMGSKQTFIGETHEVDDIIILT